eukprot:153187-Amphidinium_carterae.1
MLSTVRRMAGPLKLNRCSCHVGTRPGQAECEADGGCEEAGAVGVIDSRLGETDAADILGSEYLPLGELSGRIFAHVMQDNFSERQTQGLQSHIQWATIGHQDCANVCGPKVSMPMLEDDKCSQKTFAIASTNLASSKKRRIDSRQCEIVIESFAHC